MRFRTLALCVVAIACAAGAAPVAAQQVPLSGLGRFGGWRDNSLVGYGLVVGLSGSGDTRRNGVTRQALRNVLSRLGTSVSEDDISSRNAAVVMVVATLPASANVGDRIDVTVSSIGDARSLAGGTLLMTPMLGPDQRPYALAQGVLLTGGHSFEADLNRQQRNYPTTAVLQGGATVEAAVDAQILQSNGELAFLLSNPNFATAQRISDSVNARFGAGTASVKNADEVTIHYGSERGAFAAFVAELETLPVEPARTPRVVINERTGTIVAGGDVMISSVSISQGDIRISVTGSREAAQPGYLSGFASDASSLVVTNTRLEVEEGGSDRMIRLPNTSVADLIQALTQARVNTRRIISVLQAVKTAGALHAEIVVQ